MPCWTEVHRLSSVSAPIFAQQTTPVAFYLHAELASGSVTRSAGNIPYQNEAEKYQIRLYCRPFFLGVLIMFTRHAANVYERVRTIAPNGTLGSVRKLKLLTSAPAPGAGGLREIAADQIGRETEMEKLILASILTFSSVLGSAYQPVVSTQPEQVHLSYGGVLLDSICMYYCIDYSLALA